MEKPTREPTEAHKKRMEKELIDKMPQDTTPGEERGERISTGKAIAQGGKPDEQKAKKQ